MLDKHAVFNDLESQDYAQKCGFESDRPVNNVHLPHLSDNGSLAIQAAVPADQFAPRLGRHEDIVQLVYKVLL